MLKNEKGQGLFEFLLFLPFMLMMYQVFLTLGNAINGSINQQKATRGYMFSRIKNNSMLPSPQNALDTGLKQYGLYFTGWREKLSGDTPLAPCYPFRTFLKTAPEKCEDQYTGPTTQLIRVETVVGICSTTFQNIGNYYMKEVPNSSNPDSCTNK
jgi:hypothetical protein